jgi:hypothetical protein
MHQRLPVVFAWIISLASAMALLAMGLTAAAVIDASFTAAIAALTIITTSVGWLLVARRPRNRVGWLLASGATLLIWAFLGYGLGAVRWTSHGQHDVLGGLATVVGQISVVPALFLTFPAATMLFPDGRLPGPRWRWPFASVVGIVVGSAMLGAISAWPATEGLPLHPFPVLPPWVSELAGGASGAALIVALAMAALGILVRYRRSTGPERAQVKWLLAALGVGAVVFPVSWSTDLGPADGALVDVLSVLALGLVPIAILIAILRHRLYDIDRIVSRTVSWGIVSGVLGVLFGALVIGLQGALSGVTQGSTLAVAASTLVAFAAFQPLRRRVQEAVDRRFDRTRYDGARTAAAFAARIRDETDLRWLVGDLERTTVLSVQPGATTVWLRRRGTQS